MHIKHVHFFHNIRTLPQISKVGSFLNATKILKDGNKSRRFFFLVLERSGADIFGAKRSGADIFFYVGAERSGAGHFFWCRSGAERSRKFFLVSERSGVEQTFFFGVGAERSSNFFWELERSGAELQYFLVVWSGAERSQNQTCITATN